MLEMNLKFFYIVELNLKHSQIAKLAITEQFKGQSWLTLTSDSFRNDKECVEACKKFMLAKTQELNQKEKKYTFSYAENPYLSCPKDELDTLETNFDENALVSMGIEDQKGDWLIQAAVMVFGVDEGINRRLH